MTEERSLRGRARNALLWSAVQNWGSRLIGMATFLLLARLLEPRDFGIASAVFLLLSLLSLLAEFGLADALVQRAHLDRDDVSLPFFVSFLFSALLGLSTFLIAPRIAVFLAVEGLAVYVRAIAWICPIIVLVAVQDALYRRSMLFRPLALRTLVASLTSAVISVGMALAGFGPWSILAQYATVPLVSAVWLWSRPVWTPGLRLRPQVAREIGQFGGFVVAQRLIDFATMRSVDVLILSAHGIQAFGLFSVAVRLNSLLLQLLQSSLNAVGIAMLSRVSADHPRMQRAYLRSSSIAAMSCAPVFFASAAIAHPLAILLFGEKWAEAGVLMQPLLIVGGITSVQSVNGAYLTALGKPQTLVRLILIKAAAVLLLLVLVKPADLQMTIIVFCIGLLGETPFIFLATLRALALEPKEVVHQVGGPLLLGLLCVSMTIVLDRGFGVERLMPFPASLLLGGVFAFLYASLTILFLRRPLQANLAFFFQRRSTE